MEDMELDDAIHTVCYRMQQYPSYIFIVYVWCVS